MSTGQDFFCDQPDLCYSLSMTRLNRINCNNLTPKGLVKVLEISQR